MKVLDLQCSQGHSFEGWFGSQDDYDNQRARGLVTCPVCHDSDILKKLSAPRLNLGHGVSPVESDSAPVGHGAAWGGTGSNTSMPPAQSSLEASAPHPGSNPDTLQHMQEVLVQMVRHLIANTEDVGPQFAEEARKIHYGEREERHIRGQATPEETEALRDEGIDVMVLPVPEHLKRPLQ
jgi:hypothetical protein